MGRIRFRHALIASAGLVFASSLMAQGSRPREGRFENLPPILEKAFRAAFRITYSGERSVAFRRGHERARHVEYVLKQGARIRITFPEDSPLAGQVVVENGRERQHFFPRTNEIHVGPAMHDESFKRLQMFFRNGAEERPRVLTSPGEPVAGVRTTSVSLQDPRGNVFQRLWIDERTGMILKRELYDPVGGVVGAFEFTKVNFEPDVRPNDFTIQRPNAVRVTPETSARRLMKESGMAPAFLKEESGTRLITSRMLRRVENARVLILTYETGRAPISLVQVVGKFEAERLSRLVGKQFKSHSWQLGGRTFVLIGDMEPEALKRLAGRVEIR